jgi:ketosteroid isomerase-like protein
MSRENVEVVRRAFELLVAGDIDSLAELIPEDGELRSAIAGGSTGAIYRGVPGMRQYLADLAEAWERFDQVADEFIDLNENGVLMIFRVHARARTSGVELAQRLAVHWTFEDGKPWRGVGYSDVDEARRAVGLA